MSKKEFALELEGRTKTFAVKIIKFSALLPHNDVGVVLRKQIVRSGTSVGANYREANRSVSRADFKNKIAICEKELSETQYWLDVIREAGLINPDQVSVTYEECTQLLKLFTAIGRNLSERKF